MAAVGAWTCVKCGGMRFSAEGSNNPMMAPYAKPHVCKPKDVADRRQVKA